MDITLNSYTFDRYRYPVFSWTHNITKPVDEDIKGDLAEKYVLTGAIKGATLTALLALKTTFENQYHPKNISSHCVLNLGGSDINVFVTGLDWEPWTSQIKRTLKFTINCEIPSPTYTPSSPLAYRGSKTVTILADTAEWAKIKIPLGRSALIAMGNSGVATTVAGTYYGTTLADAVTAAEAENVSSYGTLIEPVSTTQNAIERSVQFSYRYYKNT